LADRKSRAAVRDQVERLRRCILCLTNQPTQIFQRLDNPKIFSFEFVPKNDPAPSKLQSRLARIHFGLRLEFVLDETHRVPPISAIRLSGYSFQIIDGFKTELLVYHWHPNGLSRVRTPHIHVGSSIGRNDVIAISDLHLPPGIVSLAAIVRFLIVEIGVEPNRPDWDRMLMQIDAEA